jgi:ABC-type sugar transport system ATPase subunit
MNEVVNMSDNIIAMRQGEIIATMSRETGEYSEGYLREALGG